MLLARNTQPSTFFLFAFVLFVVDILAVNVLTDTLVIIVKSWRRRGRYQRLYMLPQVKRQVVR